MTLALTDERIEEIKGARRERWSHGMAFLDYVDTVARRSRGNRAILRRCILDRDLVLPEAYALVAPWAVNSGSRWMEQLHYCVAGLYAEYGVGRPGLVDGSNFGQFCRQSAYSLGLDGGGVDTRFGVMVGGSRDELLKHLIELFRLLDRSGVGLDWFVLLEDMRYWGDRVKMRWCRDFWGGGRRGGSEDESGMEGIE